MRDQSVYSICMVQQLQKPSRPLRNFVLIRTPKQRYIEAVEELYRRDEEEQKADLLQQLEQWYATAGYSPVQKIREILQNSHPHFSGLVYEFSAEMRLKLREKSLLDKVIMNSNISAIDTRWVANTRHLVENALRHSIADVLYAIREQVATDVWQELWSVIGGHMQRDHQKLCD
jgi:inorganic pyrophosphatase/exopolyphosphatase